MGEFSVAFQVVMTIMSIGVPGLVVWVWTLWRAHTALELKVAEDYVKAATLNEIRLEVREIKTALFKVMDRLEIPALSGYGRQ